MKTCVTCIWEDFNEPLKKFILKRVQNEHDADDLLQEVFVKISVSLETLLDDDKLHAWIYRITRNIIVDYYRSKKSLEALPEDLVDPEEVTQNENANAEMAACLKGMIYQLPEKYKEALLLTEFQNFTQKELADKLGMSVSGAKSRVQRARSMLKEILLGCCSLEFDRFGNVIDYQQIQKNCKNC
jgi:RNA polymerase sigma-70 factor (ECF subfamily)